MVTLAFRKKKYDKGKGGGVGIGDKKMYYEKKKYDCREIKHEEIDVCKKKDK